MTTSEFAPAKINLALHVTGQRSDGYHDLDMLVAFANLGDRITGEAADADNLTITGPFAGDLADADIADNLVMKALHTFREFHPVSPLAITLEKNLPTASGIGGGSADAAAMLRLLARLSGKALPASLAASLGADVPMCLASVPLRAHGTGTALTPLEHLPDMPTVLVNPRLPVSTPDVFRRLGNRTNPALPDLAHLPRTAEGLSHWLGNETRNDLTDAAVAVCPLINTCLSALSEAGALVARMSGSGATCFGLFATRADAALASEAIARNHPNWWCRATVLHGADGRRPK